VRRALTELGTSPPVLDDADLVEEVIDKWCGYGAVEIDDDGLLSVTVALPGDADSLVIDAAPSQFLFQLDRAAYIEALNAARSAETFEETSEETAA
jgi:hypothetical protein